MKKITDYITKPSQAVRAMINGLLDSEKDENFVVAMTTFGSIRKGSPVCFGCAATCAVQNITGTKLTDKVEEAFNNSFSIDGDMWHILPKGLARIHEIDSEDLRSFEDAIDDLRYGYVKGLFRYFGLSIDLLDEDMIAWCYFNLPELDSNNWKDSIEPYKELVEKLEAQGL